VASAARLAVRTLMWPVSLLLLSASAQQQFAVVNLIRHGERNNNHSDIHLTHEGRHRAAYIARCVGEARHRTMAFPLGPPTKLLASERPGSATKKASNRPIETLEPLSAKMGIPLDLLHFKDINEFDNYVHSMQPGSTLLVSWQHKKIAKLAASVDPGGLSPDRWPYECNFTQWSEPGYTTEVEDAIDNCYDVIWQLLLWRASPTDRWRTRVFSMMHMGFGGTADAPCDSAFMPHSNPTDWYHAAQLSPNGVIATAAEGDAPLLALPSSLLPGANVDGWAGQPDPPPASPLPLVVAFVTGVAVSIAASRLAQGRARRASSDRLRRAHGAPLLSESTGSYAYGEPAPLPATQRDG